MRSIKFHTLLTVLAVFSTLALPAKESNEAHASKIEKVKIGGYLGSRIDACVGQRVKAQDVEELIEPFRNRTEIRRWQSEFWGKWVLGAIGSYRYTGDPELYKMIKKSAEGMISTQSSDGYIGNYSPQAQLAQWDVWGRKYTMLGLLAWYDLSGDKKALDAARKLADHLMTQVGPGRVSIVSTGNYHGMASCSILEPIVYLYERTSDARYLDFAKYILADIESPQGPGLVAKAMAGVPVSQRYPHPDSWFSRENGQKAYEMMSCYEGILELFKQTGDFNTFIAVQNAANNIIKDEINIAGSGSAFECWYGGAALQTYPTYHTMETCVTFTWMQLCHRLLNMTGNTLYADHLERSIYNALLASMKGDASQIAKYSPLEGCRTEGEEQCGMHINCCNANGPRAFAMIPQIAYQAGGNTLIINLYSESQASATIDGNAVTVTQKTSYPKDGTVEITLNPAKAFAFSVSLRIPSWSEKTVIAVNGVSDRTAVKRGAYHSITRTWKPGDKITLSLDMRGRLSELNQMQAITRGPVVLSRDSRFGDGFVDECCVISSKDGFVELIPAETKGFGWMAFTAPMVLGTDLEGDRNAHPVLLCDFASAGDTWEKRVRYRVWLPKTINVMRKDYRPY